jgi:hypothetical protein
MWEKPHKLACLVAAIDIVVHLAPCDMTSIIVGLQRLYIPYKNVGAAMPR